MHTIFWIVFLNKKKVRCARFKSCFKMLKLTLSRVSLLLPHPRFSSFKAFGGNLAGLIVACNLNNMWFRIKISNANYCVLFIKKQKHTTKLAINHLLVILDISRTVPWIHPYAQHIFFIHATV